MSFEQRKPCFCPSGNIERQKPAGPAVGRSVRLNIVFAMAAAGALFSSPVQAHETMETIDIHANYTADLLSNVDGGVEKGTAIIGRGHLTAELDGRVLGLDGVTFFTDILYSHGPEFSDRYSGDGQGVTGNQGDGRLKPLEAWVSVPLGGGLLAKAGLMDLNAEFDVQDVGGLFLHASHGMGPDYSQSGVNGPSAYPFTSVGGMLRMDGDGWTVRVAAFDPVAGSRSDPSDVVFRLPGEEGLLLAAEGAVQLMPGLGIKLGGWKYTSRFEALDEAASDGSPLRLRKSQGAYGMIEGRIAGDGASALNGWLRAGIANDRVNPIASYIGGGLTYGADGSMLGLAVAHARLGDPAMATSLAEGIAPKRTETAFELTYVFNIHERVSVQPDVQYVMNPSWRANRKDALVLGLRVGVTLF